jgi:GAF domain-containing protein
VFGEILLFTVLATTVVASGGWALKKWASLAMFSRLRAKWLFRRAAPFAVVQLTSYLTHLRDFVMPVVWRVRTDDFATVRETIRRDILEPIRSYVPSLPGEQIKIVWFRPNEHGSALVMYEQVGHTPEGQAAMALPIGAGIAGKVFTEGQAIYSADVDKDQRFQAVEHGKASGSIVCIPIGRGGGVTGVLSVLSTGKNAFRFPEILYFEALASAIGAIEVLEDDDASE